MAVVVTLAWPRIRETTARLRRRLRLAYVEGAEEWTQEHVGRSMTSDELAGVVARFGT